MKKYSRFIYKKYSYKRVGKDLRISFDFQIEPDIYFKPEITIKNVTTTDVVTLENLIFHLGLMEIPSYWKATCSPEIVIEAGYLNKEQIRWWQDLILKGMGQFFYENKLPWQKPKFNVPRSKKLTRSVLVSLRDRYLVPVGGGKDSIVTLEKLKKQKKEINAFVVNPTRAAKNVLKVAGIKNPIVVERKIDPTLLKLNKQGFLNGHTPFTAVLSFLSVFCAVLFGYKNIAFSNEKSADEGNLKYLGKVVNHQYSKTSEFERKFKWYCKKYLAKNINRAHKLCASVNYFSYLRPYTELEISKMFIKYPRYFSAFSSCNQAQRWCNSCPKCLFTYLTLCPYLNEKQLLEIFGENLVRKKTLSPMLKDLIGEGRHKPLECVGTYAEAKKAFNLCLKKNSKTKKY